MSHDQVEPVDALVADLLKACHDGRRADCAAIVKEHPEYASELSAFVDDYHKVAQRFGPLRELSGGTPGSAAEMPTLATGDTAAELPKVGGSFGDYDLLSEIARGGMGVVYKARQKSLNRVVALKMVLSGRQDSNPDRDRFLVEARAVARLNHPHIVPIYEVSEHRGQPYFTMEYFSGGSLRDQFDKIRGDQRAIARTMVTVAQAVEHAHRRGILHRDIKPTNVLLDDRGEPHVTDFGLAKRLDEESDLTQAGAIVGTPSYMAPEQANAESDLTTAVDVYGLGAMLYELLTGRPPFKGNTPLETMMAVMAADPTPPRKLDAKIDTDLETICLKCLEKVPQDRYTSADALADDLQRWLDGKPILARPASTVERLVKWSRRQPVLAGSLAAVVAACIGLLVLAGFLWQNAEARAQAVKNLGEAESKLAQVDGQRQEAEAKKSEAEKLADEQRAIAEKQKGLADTIEAQVEQLQMTADAETARANAARGQAEQAQQQLEAAQREARRTIYAADMQLAHAAWQGENISTVSDLLGRYQDPAVREDVRGFEWHYLNRQLHGARLSWRDTPEDKNSVGTILGMAISPDGKTLATAQMGNKLKLWNLADGKLLRTIETKKSNILGISFDNVTGVFFDDEGRKVVAVVRKAFDMRQMDKVVQEAMAKKEELQIARLGDSLEFQTFSLADNSPMRVEPFDANRLRTSVFPTLSGGFFLVDEGNVLMVMAMDVSPDGKFIAMAGSETKVAGGDRNRPGGITGGRLIVWNLKEGKIHAQQPSPAPLTAVAISAVGDALAVATSDGAVGVGKLDLAQPPKLMPGHHGYVYSLKFTPDGKRLASGAMDGLVLVWDAAEAKEVARLRGHTGAISRIEITPDGQSLVSGDMNGTVKVWDVARTSQSTVLRGHQSAVGSLAFTADGSELVSVTLSGDVKSWRLSDGQLQRDAKPKVMSSFIVRLSSSGKILTWKEGINDALMVRDMASGKETKLTWKDRVPFQPTVSHDDKLLAAGSIGDSRRQDAYRGGLCIWNIADGKQLATIDELRGSTTGTAFSSDNKFVAAAHSDSVVWWDWQAGTSRKILERAGAELTAVAFSADNRLIAAADSTARLGETTIRIWDLATDQLRSECHGAGKWVQFLAFSPDGRRLASGGSTSAGRGILKLWDTASGREVFSAQLPPSLITAMSFSPDGHRLAAALTPFDMTATLMGRKIFSDIYIWDATPVESDQPVAANAHDRPLQGTWVVNSAELNGQLSQSSVGDKFTFDDDKVTIENKVKKTEPITFRLDANKSPAEIDIEDKPATLGVYELKGDTLTICYGQKRPTAFDSKQGLLLKLRREPIKETRL